jgi:excisionase family DNA binding protein
VAGNRKRAEQSDLLTTAEVARMFRVESGTVNRWAHSGMLQSFKTPGGQRRFRIAELEALLAALRSDGQA